MKILYIGDVMAEPGLKLVERVLPELKAAEQIDFVVAQAENLTEGRGVSLVDFRRLQAAGVDACTGGNWTLHLDETKYLLQDPDEPIVRPANYPLGTPGLEYKYVEAQQGKVLIISLLGAVVGRDADKPMDNPLQKIDHILESQKDIAKVATIINFHGDYSSEKVVIGHYLDGRASLVVGDHWHVPTADAQVLPGSTAHQTDVGMCGVLDASLGVEFSSVIPRWRDGHKTRNIMATEGRLQFNAVLAEIDLQTGLATSVEPIRKLLDK